MIESHIPKAFQETPLPLRLSFRVTQIRADELFGEKGRRLRNRTVYLSQYAGKLGELFLGDTLLARAEVASDGIALTPVGETPLEEARVRCVVDFGSANLAARALPLREGDVVILNRSSSAPGHLRFAGVRAGWATGEYVLIDGMVGLRVDSLSSEAPGPAAVPESIPVTVSAGGIGATLTEFSEVGEGTLVGLDHAFERPFTLSSGTAELARGYIRAALPEAGTVEQRWAPGENPVSSTLMVAFVVTERLSGRLSVAGVSEECVLQETVEKPRGPSGQAATSEQEDEASVPGVGTILSKIPARRGVDILAAKGPVVSGWLLKATAERAEDAAAELLNGLYEEEKLEHLVAFVACDPRRVLPSVQQAAAKELLASLGEKASAELGLEEEPGDGNEESARPDVHHELSVSVLGRLSEPRQRAILDALRERGCREAEQVEKHLLFFDHIARLQDRDIQKVLREVDTPDLVAALSTAGEETKEAVFRNLSRRAAAMMEDDIRVLGGPGEERVEESKARIVSVLMTLREYGEIAL